MIQPLKFNFIDILWAPLRALSAKKIAVMTTFLLLALFVYNIFAYLAVALQGESPGYIWSIYNLFFFETSLLTSFTARAVFGVGLGLAILITMTGFFAVAAFEIEEARGNRFLSPLKATRFALARFKQLFFSELSILLFLGLIILLLAIFGLITRIPFIGDYLFAIFLLLPNFVIGFFVIIILVVFQISFLLLPAVAAAERHGETFNALLETFSSVIRQPLRWFGYTIYALVAAKLCSFIYAYFSFRAIQFVTWASSLGGGAKLRQLIADGLSHLPVGSEFVNETLNLFPGVDFGFTLSRWARSSGDDPAGFLVSLMLLVVFVSVIGYACSIIAVAQARGYIAIRKWKDNYSIPDEDPLFFVEEHVNPPIDDSQIK